MPLFPCETAGLNWIGVNCVVSNAPFPACVMLGSSSRPATVADRPPPGVFVIVGLNRAAVVIGLVGVAPVVGVGKDGHQLCRSSSWIAPFVAFVVDCRVRFAPEALEPAIVPLVVVEMIGLFAVPGRPGKNRY